MAKSKITIDYIQVSEEIYDFGSLGAVKPFEKRELDVDVEFWKKYVEVRGAYEKMHLDLIKLADKKGRWKK